DLEDASEYGDYDSDDEELLAEGEEEDEEELDDEVEALNEEDQAALDEATSAVRYSLFKIRRIAFSIIKSTTVLLPLWRSTCVAHKMKARLIPRDVSTRWNSTFDMLKVAIEYRAPIDTLVGGRKNKMRDLELDASEWTALEDLMKVLKVIFL
ncbi:hypothetical protein C8J57DRAFT_1086883, partial [Mycena rebaudengoi]